MSGGVYDLVRGCENGGGGEYGLLRSSGRLISLDKFSRLGTLRQKLAILMTRRVGSDLSLAKEGGA